MGGKTHQIFQDRLLWPEHSLNEGLCCSVAHCLRFSVVKLLLRCTVTYRAHEVSWTTRRADESTPAPPNESNCKSQTCTTSSNAHEVFSRRSLIKHWAVPHAGQLQSRREARQGSAQCNSIVQIDSGRAARRAGLPVGFVSDWLSVFSFTERAIPPSLTNYREH